MVDSQLPLSAIKSVRAMPEDEAPYASVEIGSEHYYLEIATVRRALRSSRYTPVSNPANVDRTRRSRGRS